MQAEIVGITETTLKILKQNGTTWTYKFKTELPDFVKHELTERQKNNWNPLAIATFKEVEGRGFLKLTEVGL